MNESRFVGRIGKSFANLVHGGGETLVKIDESVTRPQFAAHVFATDDVAAIAEEQNEQLEWLRLEPDFVPFFPEFTRANIDLIAIKPDGLARVLG